MRTVPTPLHLKLPAFFHINRCTLRAGTRWLTRFDKEVELAVRLVYEALTTGRGRPPFTVDPTHDR